MHIVFITAGGAGMFCGSCMQDNAVARALMKLDCEVSLLPTYTPIRVDQENMTSDRVFLGGINLYLDSKIPLWRMIPRKLTSWLDRPGIIRFATKFGVDNNAAELGQMTLDMLAGGAGPMQREYQELVDFISNDLKPDAIILTNALLSGIVPLLRNETNVPIYCMLQGDDIFINQLKPEFKAPAIAAIQSNSAGFSGFVTHTQFYAAMMAEELGLDLQRFTTIPLSIQLGSEHKLPAFSNELSLNTTRLPRIGSFARIAPEKGLLELVRSAKHLHDSGFEFELHAGGYLGPAYQDYFQQIQKEAAYLGERFQYRGSPDSSEEKYALLKEFDVLSVPVTYHEPKGLYVLEALSVGVPVIQPRIGSFPELIESTQGGLLFEHGDHQSHSNALKELLSNLEQAKRLGQIGQANVHSSHNTEAAAKALLKICKEGIPSR